MKDRLLKYFIYVLAFAPVIYAAEQANEEDLKLPEAMSKKGDGLVIKGMISKDGFFILDGTKFTFPQLQAILKTFDTCLKRLEVRIPPNIGKEKSVLLLNKLSRLNEGKIIVKMGKEN